MARCFTLTHSVVLMLPMHVSYIPIRGGSVHADAASLRPGGGFTTLSAAATQGVPAASASPLGTDPNSFIVRQQLVKVGVEILTQELVGDTGVAIQFIERNGSVISIATAGVESEPSRTTLGRMALRPGDLTHIAVSDLTTPHLVIVLAGQGATLSASVRLIVSVSLAVEQVPVELWHQLLKRANIVTMNMREAAALSSVLATHEPGTGIRNLMKPGAALVCRTGIMGCELQHEQGAERIQVSASETRVVDTVGVDDTHIATMCAALLRGEDIEKVCSLANAAAVIAIPHESALPVPILEQILRVVKEGRATGLTSQKA